MVFITFSISGIADINIYSNYCICYCGMSTKRFFPKPEIYRSTVVNLDIFIKSAHMVVIFWYSRLK